MEKISDTAPEPIAVLLADEAHAPLHAHVLLVEDYPANILVATTLLDCFGCTYVLAKNGQEALSLMKLDVFDLVFMDVQMPIMDGFTATGLIRIWEKEHAKPASVIVGITARALAGDRDVCINAGMNDYMSKPYLPDTFRNIIIKYTSLSLAPAPSASSL